MAADSSSWRLWITSTRTQTGIISSFASITSYLVPLFSSEKYEFLFIFHSFISRNLLCRKISPGDCGDANRYMCVVSCSTTQFTTISNHLYLINDSVCSGYGQDTVNQSNRHARIVWRAQRSLNISINKTKKEKKIRNKESDSLESATYSLSL